MRLLTVQAITGNCASGSIAIFHKVIRLRRLSSMYRDDTTRCRFQAPYAARPRWTTYAFASQREFCRQTCNHRRCVPVAADRKGSSAECGEQLLQCSELVAIHRIRDEDRRGDAGFSPCLDAVADFGSRSEESIVGEPAVGQVFRYLVGAVF